VSVCKREGATSFTVATQQEAHTCGEIRERVRERGGGGDEVCSGKERPTVHKLFLYCCLQSTLFKHSCLAIFYLIYRLNSRIANLPMPNSACLALQSLHTLILKAFLLVVVASTSVVADIVVFAPTFTTNTATNDRYSHMQSDGLSFAKIKTTRH